MAEEESEVMKRIRAAAGYMSGDGVADLARKIKPSAPTLYRRGREGRLENGEAYEIHDKTGAPMWFLKYGWEGWKSELTPEGLERLADELFPNDPPGS